MKNHVIVNDGGKPDVHQKFVALCDEVVGWLERLQSDAEDANVPVETMWRAGDGLRRGGDFPRTE
ncbi:hypothetical protein HanIR_Chr15g0772321 [Helianthus annuus]|nr:hypothetical protein HanIR_Chr15g0772321 [Helianthus annuus]